MDFVSVQWAPPPAAGKAKPGNLYADLQTRTLWLGVDAAVDPAQAVLISDIMTLTSMIDDAVDEANAYTDTRILTRAPTVHTHTASQITDFTSAVTAVVNALPGISYVHGMILKYFGSLADIGVGPLAGWSLCDGSNGTPDLRDKFIIGAGNKTIGAKNTGGITTDPSQGGHTHTVNATAITIAQMPAHDHTPGTGGQSANHTHTVSVTGATDAQGVHTHTFSYTRGATGAQVQAGQGGLGGGSAAASGTTDAAGNHAHNVSASGTTSGFSSDHTHAVYAQGGGQGHTHTLVGGGGVHSHTLTASDLREAVPYFALAFIMKL